MSFVLAIGGAVQICISGSIYAEYEEVISRPRFRRDESTIASTLRTIRDKSIWVRPTEIVQVRSDADDDIFLECAQAAQADYLVTGNIKDFPASWSGTQIVTPAKLLDIDAGRH